MHKSILACLVGIGALVSARAGTVTYDFKTDPTLLANPIQIYQTGFADGSGESQYWRGSGGNPDGFLAITWPLGSSSTIAVFPDIDQGKIVTAFKFECDLRVGSPQQDARPADGFSVNFARSNDPVFQNHSANDFATAGAVETGTQTGLAISFDTWAGNTLPDGGDIEGIIVRVDNKTILRQAMPTRNGACNDNTSLQTGLRDAQYWADANASGTMPDAAFEPASWAQLCWQHLSVEVDEQSKLTVIWKGRKLLDKFQTSFFPSAGGIVLAGRTGGADEHTHFDNLTLSTTSSTVDTTKPTDPGVPTVVSAGARFATLKWDPSTDDSGRVGYEVSRDGGTPTTSNTTEFTDSGLLPGKSYTYSIRAVDVSGNASAAKTVTVKTGAEQDVVGFLLGEIYDNIPGTDVGSLVFSDAYFDKIVSRGVYLNGLSFNVNPGGGFGDNYGIVIKGVLTAPKTGQFDFFVRSDDASQFFLNQSGATPPDPAIDLWIAEETGCCNAFQEVGATQTTISPISLTAGREYGFTFVVKEGGGGDWGEVAMREVGDTTPANQLAPITGAILKGKGDPTGADIKITKQPPNTTGEEGSFAAIEVEAEVTSPYGAGTYYQWNKNGAAISGATRSTLVLRNLTTADEGKYSVSIGTMGKVVTSSEATLKVVPPGQLPAAGSGSVDVRVSSGLDDSEEHMTEGNAIDITSSDLEIPDEGGGGDLQEIGIRFRDIAVPKGAAITKANIQFTVDEADDEVTSVRIYGELAPDSAAFTTNAGDISSRTKTTAFVDWNNIPVWNDASIGSAGPDQLTPDLSSIVREIIAQPGWNGNTMTFIIVANPGGERTAESYDGDPAAAPLLHIEWDSGKKSLLTDGLVAHWNFDGNLNDSVASFNGVARGPVGFEAGKDGFGQAIALDGTGYVEITGGNNKDLQFPGKSMSISGWFKVGTFDKSWQALISKGEGTNYRVARRGGEPSIAYAGGVGEGTNDAPDVDDGNWHHFVAVSDHLAIEFGTALYVDGARYEVNATAPVLADGDFNLFIGENPGAVNRQWIGSIDDIGIWNRVLSASEVSQLYNGGAGTSISTLPKAGPAIKTDGLVAYWNFDGDLSDSVASFNGEARGPVAFEAGKAGFGQAIALDGTGFVEITGGNNKDLQFPGKSMSISGWFKVGTFDKDWQALISKGEGTNYRVARRGGEPSIAYAGGVGEGTNDAPDVNDGNWHHFAAVSDHLAIEFGTALYIDGARYEVNATPPVLADGDLNLFIGENPGALNRRWIGSIDDISIWNRVLTADEVSALYADGAGVPLSSVVVGGGGGAGMIGVSRTATGVTITFEGTLQSADSITGPFTDVPGATSPATIPFSGSGKFYRFRK